MRDSQTWQNHAYAPIPRACIGGSGPCSDGGIAVPGGSRCRSHTRSGWHSKPKVRDLAYATPEYKANRKATLDREPSCHWRLPGCTGISTTADHLDPVSRGGSNQLGNLVGACEHCNRIRGVHLANDTKRRRNPK